MRLEQRTIRIPFVKRFRLFARPLELLPLAQHVDVIEPYLDIVGFELDRAFQQEFRIVQDTQPQADLGQQSHAFHMPGVPPQEMAA